MRNIGQPCGEVWQEQGPAAAVEVCRARGEACPTYRDVELDAETGLPQTCALLLWERMLAAAGVAKRERLVLRAGLMNAPALATRPPLTAVTAWLAHEACDLGKAGRLRGDEALLVLGGTRGAGKTIAACYALAHGGPRGMPGGRYLLADELMATDAPLKRWAREPILVIDQLGHEYFGKDNADWGQSRFEAVLDRRYANLLPTILCGNLDRDDFAKRYGPIIEDRLTGDGAFLFFKLPSLRGRAA